MATASGMRTTATTRRTRGIPQQQTVATAPTPTPTPPAAAVAPRASTRSTRATRPARRTTQLVIPPSTSASPSAPLATLVAVPAHYLPAIGAEDQAELALAQASWLARQASLDPRIPRYSEQVTPGELAVALRVLRGLFETAHGSPHVSLRGALRWAALLLALADDAEAERRAPLLPLPYLWLAQAELDEREQADKLTQTEDVLAPRTTKNQKRRAPPRGTSKGSKGSKGSKKRAQSAQREER